MKRRVVPLAFFAAIFSSIAMAYGQTDRSHVADVHQLGACLSGVDAIFEFLPSAESSSERRGDLRMEARQAFFTCFQDARLRCDTSSAPIECRGTQSRWVRALTENMLGDLPDALELDFEEWGLEATFAESGYRQDIRNAQSRDILDCTGTERSEADRVRCESTNAVMGLHRAYQAWWRASLYNAVPPTTPQPRIIEARQ